MARQPSLIFEYKLPGNGLWTEAKTHSDNSAVIIAKIIKMLNNPSIAEVLLSNRSRNSVATDTTAKGNLTGILTDFMDCRIIDNETGQVFYRGKVYSTKTHYDLQYGNTIKVVLKDNLQELAEYPIDDAPPALKNINLTTYNNRSKIVKRMATQLTVDAYDFTDTTKFENSAHDFTANDKKTGEKDDDGDYLWNVASGRQNALQVIHDFASHDPHSDDTVSEHFGADYYVDPNFTSYAKDHYPAPAFNYFKRNTRPGTNQTADANPFRHGITIEYPSDGWTGETGQTKAMMHDAEFNSPKDELYTKVVGHYEDTGEGSGEDANDDAEAQEKRKVISSFELVEGTVGGFAESGGTSTGAEWTSNRLYYKNMNDLHATTGQSAATHNPMLVYRAIPASGNSTSDIPCGVLTYHSGNGSGEFVVLSNLYDQPDYTDTITLTTLGGAVANNSTQTFTVASTNNMAINQVLLVGSEKVRIEAINSSTSLTVTRGFDGTTAASSHSNGANVSSTNTGVIYTDESGGQTVFESWNNAPFTGSTTLRLFLHKNKAANATDQPYIDINPDECRTSRKYGIKKPLRIQIKGMDSYDKLRKEIAAKLDRTGHATVTKAVTHISRYPYHKIICAAGNIARQTSSGDHNQLIVSNNGWANTRSSSNAVATNDARTFGLRKGMVVAEISSTGAVTRYSYVSELGSNYIRYGGSPSNGSDTSDSTAFDTSNRIAIYIPVEPGHAIRVKNKVWAKDFDILVQKIEYTVQPGIMQASIEGVGLDNNEAGVPGVPPSIVKSEVAGSSDKGYAINIPTGQQRWTISDGRIEALDFDTIRVVSTALKASGAATTSTDSNLIRSYVTLLLADGRTYRINTTAGLDIGGSGGIGTAGEPHVLYIRPGGSQTGSFDLLATAKSSTTASDITYDKLAHHTDIKIGWATKDTDTSGKAILTLSGDIFGSPGQLDITAIANNRLTSSLMKKGAQPFATDVKFKEYPSGSSSVYNKIQWEAGNISFSEGTDGITINAGNSDQNFTSAGGVNISSGMAADTTYYVYYTIGGNTLAITTSYVVPFQDDKVLLATVVTGPVPSPEITNYSPTILPYNGKVPTLSAVSIAANSITADSIVAGTITADEIEAQAITTKLSSDMTGVTLDNTSGGRIYSGKPTYGAGTGWHLSYNSGTPRFDIGNHSTGKYFRWDGTDIEIAGNITGVAKIEIGGTGVDNSGSGSSAATSGQIAMRSASNQLAMRFRTNATDAGGGNWTEYPLQMDILGRGMWLVCNGTGTEERVLQAGDAYANANPALAGIEWAQPNNFIAPGLGNGRTYLGAVHDAGNSPNNYGVGWKGLVLGASSAAPSGNSDGDPPAVSDGTLVLIAHPSTTKQYTFQFPQQPPADGNDGYVLQSTHDGVTSWVANGSSSGDITAVTAGTGLSGGGTSGAVTLTNAGVTSIVAGSNISISGATGAVTITATDTNTTYSAGTGLTLSSTTFSLTDPIKLGLGSNTNPTYASTDNSGNSGLYFTTNGFTTYPTITCQGSRVVQFSSNMTQWDSDLRPFVSSTDSSTGENLGWTTQRWNYGYIRDVVEGTSDATLKENLIPISNATNFIKNLVPYEYNFIADRTASVNPLPKHFGITAQNLKETLDAHGYTNNSAWLDEVDDDGNHIQYNVREKKLIHVLIAAVKELEARIATLEG